MRRSLIPRPASATGTDETFPVTAATSIRTPPGSAEAARIAEHLAGVMRRSTGYPLPVSQDAPAAGSINFQLVGDARPTAGGELGDEGYALDVTGEAVTLRAAEPAGLFRGVQTLRQLLPAAIESDSVTDGPWTVPGARIVDRPRFRWRGVMLDVARHFFDVADVKRYLDLAALYKVNVAHLHLTDDQGWRIAIEGWPRLAQHGGSTEVGGGPGGFYTQADYAEIIAYARQRYITVVPEVDVPGHTNAALASYSELNCDGQAPHLYTGVRVGFSALCVDREQTYAFLDDVFGQLAELTPGPYLHVGGDEVERLSEDEYVAFIERVQRIVASQGKRMIGWEEIAQADLRPTSVVQFWNDPRGSAPARAAVEQGVRLVMSPATRTYLDMKYDEDTELGFMWAGPVSVREAYDWDPATLVDGVDAADVLGVEAPLWSETLETIDDVEFMAFPRLPGIAEIGWSRTQGREWREYRQRLARHAPRWAEMEINYYRSPQVPWP